jgi:glycine/D-amino acid oxidase-like deaminating enzyme
MGVSRHLKPTVNFDTRSGVAWAGGFFGNGVGASNLAGRTLADLILGNDSERVHAAWVNTGGHEQSYTRWEPEPLRWLGVSTRRNLMAVVDGTEYSNSVIAPMANKLLNLFP